MTSTMLKILINLAIFLLIAGGSIIYLWKLKLENKGYKYLFIVYTIFWMSLMLVRPYRGTLQKEIDANLVWLALAVYGFIGIFARIFADYLNFLKKNRKCFLYIAALSQVILFIPIIVSPTSASSILQAIAVGIGASCIGSFELLFKEQYNQKKVYLTVSLLSIPPLLANFITAPIQSLMVSASKTNGVLDLNIFKYLWVIGLLLALLSFIMIFFIRENRLYFASIKTKKINNKNQYLNLFSICIIGFIIMFIKFSNSGGVATLHLQTLGKLTNHDTSSYEGYLSVVFSIFQLIGGVLVGTILIKKMKSIQIFYLGIICWVLYTILAMFNTNSIGFFFIHSINGFSYGILYNLVLGQILSFTFKSKKITPMGIYQSVLAIGIACSSIYTEFLKNAISKNTNYYLGNIAVDGGLLVAIILLSGIYSVTYFYNKKHSFYHKEFNI